MVLRDLSAEKAEAAPVALGELPRDGLPNYFDDQRFGSVGFDGGFIAQAWLVGDHEQALRLAIAEPNPSDRPDARAEKAILRESWGDWPEAKARLARSHARSLVTYLVDHPTDFRGAFARLRRELRSLYFSAFQSHLWNLLLGPPDRADHPPRPADDRRLQGRHPADPPRARPRPGRRPRRGPAPAARLADPAARRGPGPRLGPGRRRRLRPGLGGPPGQAPQGRLLLQGGPPRPLLRRGPDPGVRPRRPVSRPGQDRRSASSCPRGPMPPWSSSG